MSVRLERAIQILVLLQSRVPYNTLQLAQELKVHRRTIFRDIAALRKVGVDVLVDPESGSYSLPNEPAVTLESVSDAELTELIVTAAFSPLATSAAGKTARRAMLKLLRRLPRALSEQAARVIRAAEPGAMNGKAVIIDRVLESIRKRLVLEIVTDESGRGPKKFGFQPQRFSFDAGGGKAAGRIHPDLRSAVVDLAAIREVRLTETPFVEVRFDPPHSE